MEHRGMLLCPRGDNGFVATTFLKWPVVVSVTVSVCTRIGHRDKEAKAFNVTDTGRRSSLPAECFWT